MRELGVNGARPYSAAPPVKTNITPLPAQSIPLVIRLAVGETGTWVNRLGWIAFVGLLLIGFGQCFTPVTGQDEGELLVYPWLIAHGHVPYRDIWMMYPPSTYLILAGLFKIGIPGLLAERGLSFGVRVAIILLVNRTLSGHWKRFSWIGTPMVSSLLFYEANTDLRAYPWVIGMPLVFLGLLAVEKHPTRARVFFFLAGTFRYEFALAGLIALGAYAILHLPNRTRALKELQGAAVLAAATLLFCLGLALSTNSTALQESIVQPIRDISPGRRLPLFPLHFGWWGVPLEFIVLLGPLLLIAAGLRCRRPAIVATNLACLALTTHFLQRADWAYLLWVGAIVVPWLLITLLDLPAGAASSPPDTPTRGILFPHPVRWAIGIIGITVSAWYTTLVMLLAFALSPLSPFAPGSIWHGSMRIITNRGNTVIVASRSEAADDRALITYLNHHAGRLDTVFIAPRALRYAIWNMTSLYYILGLPPASKYLEMNPGVETRASVQREVIRELRTCRWVVLTRAGYWYEPNASQIPGSPLLARSIHSQYHPVFTRPTFQLLERETSVRTAMTPLPDPTSLKVSQRV